MDTIITSRLILRDFALSDLNDFYEYASVEGVGECAGWNHHTSKEESEGVLKNFISDGNNYALVDKSSNKVIGSLGLNKTRKLTSDKFLKEFPDKRTIELGYVLSKDYWGKGLMTEAVKAVIDYLFTKDKYDVIFICHYDFNKRSDRVIAKCGLHYWFTEEHIYVEPLGKYYDNLVFYIAKEEYLINKK